MYLGEIPDYVLANGVYLSETFPTHEIVLITDSQAQADRVDFHGLTSWVCPDVRTSWKKVSNFSTHKTSFRNDFWFKTVARFYALYEYKFLEPEEPLLHVEADVWLSQNFPLNLFSEIQGKIAYPLKNSSEGIASTLFVSDLKTLQVLIEYTERCFELDSLSTDVSVLGSFHQKFPGLFENLPTFPLGANFLKAPTSKELAKLLSRNFEKYLGVFDASSLGIHYTGVDPRNNWGFRTLFDTPGSPMELSEVLFTVDKNVPALKYAESVTEVFSLHVHSKDIRLFRTESYLSRLQAISSFNQAKRRHEFDGIYSLSIFVKTLITKFLLTLRQAYRGLK